LERDANRLRQFVQGAKAILKPAGAASKFVMYYELLEAFKKPGCPVCTRLEEGSLKAMDDLLYEQVTDPATRARLVESRGFCNWHTWMLPRIQNSSLGAALIYQHLLTTALGRLKAAQIDRRPGNRWRRLRERVARKGEAFLPLVAWWRNRAGCPMCALVRRSEQEHLKALLRFLGEAEFSDGFAGSAGLCLPHLHHASTIGPDHPNLPLLLSAHETRWSALSAELAEFIRKNDYRFATEAMGQEGTSWRRVLEVFVGRAGVFGPDCRGERANADRVDAAGPAPAGMDRSNAQGSPQTQDLQSADSPPTAGRPPSSEDRP